MKRRDVVVVGGSAGALQPLRSIVHSLPRDLPAALFVVIHVPPHSESVLPQLLTTWGKLPALHAVDGELIKAAHIYVAPPDHHLLVYPSHVRVIRGPKENRHRPAIDPLFRSAAGAYGERVIGVLLSGALSDGSAGLAVVKQAGGIAVVQDPEEALTPAMPRNALERVRADHLCRAEEIGPLLSRLVDVERPVVPVEAPPVVASEALPEPGGEVNGRAVYSCPDCGGVLVEGTEGGAPKFRCTVGHQLTEQSLIDGQQETLESALWAALRALEERASLLRSIGRRMRGVALSTAKHFDAQAREAERRAGLVRQALSATPEPGPERAAATDDG